MSNFFPNQEKFPTFIIGDGVPREDFFSELEKNPVYVGQTYVSIIDQVDHHVICHCWGFVRFNVHHIVRHVVGDFVDFVSIDVVVINWNCHRLQYSIAVIVRSNNIVKEEQ